MAFIWNAIIAMVTMVAQTSLIGNEAQIPSSPNLAGRTISNGIRNMTWRERLRKIDFQTFPMLWKNVVDTIWNPTTQNIVIESERARSVVPIRTGSVVNARAITDGHICPIRVPMMTIPVLQTTASE